MSAVFDAWSAVTRRSPPARKSLIADLKSFLDTLDNPHARILSGRLSTEEVGPESAQTLEAWVVKKFYDNKLSKMQAADWLRLLFDVITELNQHGQNLHLTRLADVERPMPSPFSPDSMARQRRVEAWRKVLYEWIANDAPETEKPPEQWLGAIAISAAVHGALVDSSKLNQLIKSIVQGKAPVCESGFCSVVFNLPFQGLGNHHLQRWFVDPLTEMLIWRYLALPKVQVNLSPDKLIKNFLMTRIHKEFRPKNQGDFLQSVLTWWSQRASPIDLHCATRSVVSHSINERTWARLHHLQHSSGPNFNSAGSIPPDDAEGETAPEDVLLLNPWLQEALQALTLPSHAAAQAIVQALIKETQSDTRANLYLQWLSALLDGMSATKGALALSTIKRRFGATAPRLVGVLGTDNPEDLTTPELEDVYSELITEPDPSVPVKSLAEGIRDFHAFMHWQFGKPFMVKESDVLGDEHSVKPVDSTILSFDEYLVAQNWLAKQRANQDETKASQLVLAFAFRMGLRRMEIFGLRRKDIDVSRYPTCLIRKNELRRLKTENSRRAIPLLAFLKLSERQMLLSWIQEHSGPLSQQDAVFVKEDFLFPQFAGEGGQAWVDKITKRVCDAIRHASGDSSLFLHHLRHSFGTWAYLRLRAPDFPGIARHFEHLPATSMAIRTGRRLRVLLYGRDPGVSRTYAFSVARLLGHSSPAVSLGHYVHSADLILGALTRRECAQIPKSVFLAACGYQKTAGYDYMNQSIDVLLSAFRERFVPTTVRNRGTPPIVKRARGRPMLAAAHERPGWIALDQIRHALALFVVEKMSTADIAHERSIDEHRLGAIIESANKLGGLIGLKTDTNGRLAEIPLAPREKNSIEFCDLLEKRLAEMAVRAPVLYSQGVDLYLEHFDPDKHDVIFRGPKDLKKCDCLLRFFESLDLPVGNFQWIVRVVDTSNPELPSWAKKLNAKWQPMHRKAIKPKNAIGATSYSQWIAVQPVDENRRSMGFAVAKTIFLASIVFVRHTK